MYECTVANFFMIWQQAESTMCPTLHLRYLIIVNIPWPLATAAGGWVSTKGGGVLSARPMDANWAEVGVISTLTIKIHSFIDGSRTFN